MASPASISRHPIHPMLRDDAPRPESRRGESLRRQPLAPHDARSGGDGADRPLGHRPRPARQRGLARRGDGLRSRRRSRPSGRSPSARKRAPSSGAPDTSRAGRVGDQESDGERERAQHPGETRLELGSSHDVGEQCACPEESRGPGSASRPPLGGAVEDDTVRRMCAQSPHRANPTGLCGVRRVGGTLLAPSPSGGGQDRCHTRVPPTVRRCGGNKRANRYSS